MAGATFPLAPGVPAPVASDPGGDGGLLQATLDAIHGEDETLAGMPLTRLLTPLLAAEIATMQVESTLRFGDETEGTADAKLLVGGEIITATGRTSADPFTFTGLARGLEGSTNRLHPPGTLVFDLSRNASRLDHVRRGFFVDTAIGADLDVIGRNLGLIKCIGISDDEWREIIRTMAYLPKQTIDAFRQTLLALLGDPSEFAISEKPITDPWKVFVEIIVTAAITLPGRFVLNSAEAQLTTGAMTVDTNFTIIEPPLSDTLAENGAIPNALIAGRTFIYPASATGTLAVAVYDDTELARRGVRAGLTNYATGGSVAGNTITLGSSPGGVGTAVLVDYTGWSAHYLAQDETIRQSADFYAYLADPLLAARCLLEQVRAAGVRVELSSRII